jgi:CheY-like chemotaxis protein
MKVLVIEDHEMQRKLADDVLSAAGHDVGSAADVSAALASVRRDRPDVILLDLALPGLDGLALAQMLKSDPALRDISIIAVTSFPERFPRAAAMAAGCDAYLVKPVSTRALPDLVTGAARKKEKESS